MEIQVPDRGAAWGDGTTARSAVKVHGTMEAGGDAGATAKAYWPIKVARDAQRLNQAATGAQRPDKAAR